MWKSLSLALLVSTCLASDSLVPVEATKPKPKKTEYSNPSFNFTDEQLEVRLKALPQEECLSKAYRYGKGLAFGFAVCNAAGVIYAQQIEDNSVNLGRLLWPFIGYAGVTLGLETLINRAQPEHLEFSLFGILAALVSAVPNTFFLWQAEDNHHIISGDQGWDQYFTFFTCVAPFVFVNDFLTFGRLYCRLGFDRNPYEGYCNWHVERLSAEGVKYYYHLIGERELQDSKNVVTAPIFPPRHEKVTKWRVATDLLIPLVCAPATYSIFQQIGHTLLPDGETEDALIDGFSSIAAMTFYAAQVSTLRCSSFSLINLAMFPQSLFKSLPTITLLLKSTANWRVWTQTSVVGVFALLNSLQYTTTLKQTVSLITCTQVESKRQKIKRWLRLA